MELINFETRVQELKYQVLKNVIIELEKNNYNLSFENIFELSQKIIPGPKASFRCCVYKEREIVRERIKLILNSSSKDDSNVIKVVPVACDECSLGGYYVSDECRGCIAHKCYENCPRKCISFNDDLKASIDKSKCINCGMCAKSCPFNAIDNKVRPCERACKVKAISSNIGITNEAKINDEKCIHCGACVYSCPFGAIVDVSFIKEVLEMLHDSKIKHYNVYAVVAPSIGGNFLPYKTGQVIEGIKELGFCDVYEAALGADMVALTESKELVEKGTLFSSCCPAYASYIKKFNPDLAKYISTSLSPMAEIARYIKKSDSTSKVVFIGPCTAKKSEIKNEAVKKYVDSAITFEELLSFFDAKNIKLKDLKEAEYKKGSAFGRGFAQCGGLLGAVKQALKEENIDFDANGVNVSGIDNIKNILLKFKTNQLEAKFIEGMACENGCIGGPCNLEHNIKSKIAVSKFSESGELNIKENILTQNEGE